MKGQNFTCQYNGQCVIDKSIRCACRHCRFQKCLKVSCLHTKFLSCFKVGMNREAIQQNRDPIGYTKRTRRYPQINQSVKSANVPQLKSQTSTISNSQFFPTNPEMTPEQISEELMLENLMRVECHVSLVR